MKPSRWQRSRARRKKWSVNANRAKARKRLARFGPLDACEQLFVHHYVDDVEIRVVNVSTVAEAKRKLSELVEQIIADNKEDESCRASTF